MQRFHKVDNKLFKDAFDHLGNFKIDARDIFKEELDNFILIFVVLLFNRFDFRLSFRFEFLELVFLSRFLCDLRTYTYMFNVILKLALFFFSILLYLLLSLKSCA